MPTSADPDLGDIVSSLVELGAALPFAFYKEADQAIIFNPSSRNVGNYSVVITLSDDNIAGSKSSSTNLKVVVMTKFQ